MPWYNFRTGLIVWLNPLIESRAKCALITKAFFVVSESTNSTIVFVRCAANVVIYSIVFRFSISRKYLGLVGILYGRWPYVTVLIGTMHNTFYVLQKTLHLHLLSHSLALPLSITEPSTQTKWNKCILQHISPKQSEFGSVFWLKQAPIRTRSEKSHSINWKHFQQSYRNVPGTSSCEKLAAQFACEMNNTAQVSSAFVQSIAFCYCDFGFFCCCWYSLSPAHTMHREHNRRIYFHHKFH